MAGGCDCKWTSGPELGDVDLSYDLQEEKLTVSVPVVGEVQTGSSNSGGTVKVTANVELSVYRYINADWVRFGRAQETHDDTLKCNNKKNKSNIPTFQLVSALDSVHLAGRNLVLLVKCSFKVGGDCGGSSDGARFIGGSASC
jgi:hypothetical protein